MQSPLYLVVLYLLWFGWTQALDVALASIQSYNFSRAETFKEAMRFLHEMNNPANCTGIEYVQVDMGCGGGFAAHFQLAGAEWLRTAKALNYSKPVIIVGHIRGYSDGPECQHVNKDWTCFFLPMSEPACQREMLKTGKRVGADLGAVKLDDTICPNAFSHVGLAYWWGVVQARMFRLQPEIAALVAAESRRMDRGRGFPLPERLEGVLGGVHVRHGDKSSDGFKHHSFEAELAAASKSPECALLGVLFGGCVRTYNDTLLPTAAPGMRLYVASDDASVLISARIMVRHACVRSMFKCRRMLRIGPSSFPPSTSNASLHRLPSQGHLVKEHEGISTQTSSAGMFKTLLAHTEVAYNATVEVITDIVHLGRCSTLVGIAASQIFRLAVGLSNATGALQYAAAMDYHHLPRIRAMSAKWALPLPEAFVSA